MLPINKLPFLFPQPNLLMIIFPFRILLINFCVKNMTPIIAAAGAIMTAAQVILIIIKARQCGPMLYKVFNKES